MDLIILDDNALDHFILDKMLSKWDPSGHIIHCYDGTDLIRTIEQTNVNALPDIIFLDIHMPKMDGWKFLNQLNRIKKHMHKTVCVYVLSSSIDPVDISRSKKYSFVQGYLIKPISYEKIETIFEHRPIN